MCPCRDHGHHPDHPAAEQPCSCGPASPPAPTSTETKDTVEDSADKEEEAIRQHLQGVLKNCASSLGLDLEAQKAIEIPDEDFGKDEDPDKRSKRPRSLEPCVP